jgi:hypothetical protein
MKSVLISFVGTGLLLMLHVLPPSAALQGAPTEADRAFAARHGNESASALEAELGLGR